MSIGQFFLGLVTLLVATVVYRWQKLIEREAEQQKELRRLYTEYTSALKFHEMSQPFIGDENIDEKAKKFRSLSVEEIQIYALRDQIYLLGSTSVTIALVECDRKFRDWKIAFNTEYTTDERGKGRVQQAFLVYREQYEALLEAMKRDLIAHTSWVPPVWLERLIGKFKVSFLSSKANDQIETKND